MKELVNLLHEFDPVELTNGEIRTRCIHEENHTDGSGLMSMFLSTDKNAYHCFSCGAKGTLTSLLTNKLGLSFYDATEYVNLDNLSYDSYEEKKSRAVKNANSVFNGRKLEFVPHKFFTAKRFKKSTLEHFKVGFYEEDGKIIHTVPLYQRRRIVGVKYRQTEPFRNFWYSTNFDRRRFIYNEPNSKDEIILVEGESDVWRSYENDLQSSATLGTQVNEEQLDRLKRFKRVILAFDNDFAGFVAKEKVYNSLKDHTEVLFMPYDAEDPGECSYENWQIAYANICDYLSYQLEMYEHLPEGEYDKILAVARGNKFV